jgi:uncharacterized membrane protein
MYRTLVVIVIAATMAACMSVTDAVKPGESAASVTVSTNMTKEKNIKVRYQGANSCSAYPGKLIAMLNSITVGIEGGQQARVRIPTGAVQVISIMGMAPMREVGAFEAVTSTKQVGQEYGAALRELYFAFMPELDRQYFFEFNTDGHDVALHAYEQTAQGSRTALESLPLPEDCKGIPIKQM